MAVTVSEYSAQHGTELRLVNLKNIHAVLEENEMEAWQKLIRVLTHEIMNSIAPIISLSETLSERAVQNGMNERDYNIMLQGMQTIHRRSKGLLNFVENYRKLSRLSVPILAPVNIGDLLSDMKKLVSLIKQYRDNEYPYRLQTDKNRTGNRSSLTDTQQIKKHISINT